MCYIVPRKRAMKYAKTTDATKPKTPIPGTAQIVAAGSRGGNPVITVAYNIMCLNGQYSTTTVVSITASTIIEFLIKFFLRM
jgi:hypothetical protein